MDIKIPSGLPGAPSTEAVEGALEGATKGEAAEAAGAVPTDAVSKIATQLQAGEITRTEAVEQLVDEALVAQGVENAPAEARAELAEVLGALLDSDPYLQSLVARLGSPSGE